MEKVAENLKDNAKKLEDNARELESQSDRTNLALAEMRLQFETMMEMQKQERADMAKLHAETEDKIRKHYGRIILGLILTICLILGGIIGGAIYLFSNFDIDFGTYIQEPTVGGNGNSTIYDGIHYNVS